MVHNNFGAWCMITFVISCQVSILYSLDRRLQKCFQPMCITTVLAMTKGTITETTSVQCDHNGCYQVKISFCLSLYSKIIYGQKM